MSSSPAKPRISTRYDRSHSSDISHADVDPIVDETFLDSSIIDHHVAAYVRTHSPPVFESLTPQQLDDVATYTASYDSALDLVAESKSLYNSLPMKLHHRFRTPDSFFKFLASPDNYDEAVRMGLIVPKVDAASNEANRNSTSNDFPDEEPPAVAPATIASVKK